MKHLCGTTGMLLLLFGSDLPLSERGMVLAALFLGICLCLAALALMAHPLLEWIVIEWDTAYYVKQHEMREINNQHLQITLDKEKDD
ncbi:hypothetical protein [Geotalea uraniireducens]|uniref:Uncharacterized protein n=1 Tax=Geotalea uraniireducens (strain Rf4) TaxID=351605 RepID=A5G930_GEOUR|nr:hypothetical protein [Geotalea uraniireducens]ABQ28298.1 hypothetical protein Gura_4155 [Geotalea uraniireducens Rf4]